MATVDAPTLARAIRAVEHARGAPALRLDTIQVVLDTDALHVVATDGFRAAMVAVPWCEPPVALEGRPCAALDIEVLRAAVGEPPAPGPVRVEVLDAERLVLGHIAVPAATAPPRDAAAVVAAAGARVAEAVTVMPAGTLRRRLAKVRPTRRGPLQLVQVLYLTPTQCEMWSDLDPPPADTGMRGLVVQASYLRQALQPVAARELVRVVWGPNWLYLAAALGPAAAYEAMIMGVEMVRR